jgi:hypothetical protein
MLMLCAFGPQISPNGQFQVWCVGNDVIFRRLDSGVEPGRPRQFVVEAYRVAEFVALYRNMVALN